MKRKDIALAKVGILALVDEVTGYQEERFKDKEALRKKYREYLKERKNIAAQGE